MGYRTNYGLCILDADTLAEKSEMEPAVLEALTEIADTYTVTALRDGAAMKWYYHDEHMRELSRRFPGVLFSLHGEGDDAGDLWLKFYLDGKAGGGQAKIVYPTFDPEQMCC